MIVHQKVDVKKFVKRILLPLLNETQYFSSTLRHCIIQISESHHHELLLPHLQQIRSLTKLDLEGGWLSLTSLNQVKSIPNLQSLRLPICNQIAPKQLQEEGSTNIHFQTSLCSFEASSITDCTALVKQFSSSPPSKLHTLILHNAENLDFAVIAACVPHLEVLEINTSKNTTSLDCIGKLSKLASLKLQCITTKEEFASLGFLSSLQDTLQEFSFMNSKFKFPGASANEFHHLSSLRHLRVLQIVGIQNFNDDCLMQIFDPINENSVIQNNNLRELDLRRTPISKSGLWNALQHQQINTLESFSLQMSMLTMFDTQDENILSHLLSRMKSLKFLALTDCEVTDEDLKSLPPTLESLEIYHGHNITNEGFNSGLKELVNLKKLRVMTNDRVNEVSCLLKMKKLETLMLYGFNGLTSDSFRIFSEHEFSSSCLQSIDLSSCRQLNDEVIRHFSKNKNLLKCLIFSRCSNEDGFVTDEKKLIKNVSKFRQLKSLIGIVEKGSALELKLKKEQKNLEHVDK